MISEKLMRTTLAAGGLFLLVLSLGGLVWQQRLQSVTTPNSAHPGIFPSPTVTETTAVLGLEIPTIFPDPSPLPDPDGWLTFRSDTAGYTVRYPPKYDFEIQLDDSQTLTAWGPTQQANTEFYDGVSLRFVSGTYPTGSLYNFVQTQADALRTEPVVTFVSTVNPVLIGNLSGWQFFTESITTVNNLYFPINANRYLAITDATRDPTGQGFSSIVSQILATLTLNAN